GFPGTNTFIGELLILVGAFAQNLWMGAIAIGGVVLSVAYMLWMLQRVIWAEHTRPPGTVFTDLDGRELATLLPLLVLVFWIGLNPGPFLERVQASVENLVAEVSLAGSVDVRPLP